MGAMKLCFRLQQRIKEPLDVNATFSFGIMTKKLLFRILMELLLSLTFWATYYPSQEKIGLRVVQRNYLPKLKIMDITSFIYQPGQQVSFIIFLYDYLKNVKNLSLRILYKIINLVIKSFFFQLDLKKYLFLEVKMLLIFIYICNKYLV